MCIQPVSGFRLDGGSASGVGVTDALFEQFGEGMFAGFPGGVHGDCYATCRVVVACHSCSEFLATVAGEDHVGVAVDPPRQHCPAFAVDFLVSSWRFCGWTDPLNGAVLNDHRPVVNDAAFTHCM